MNFICQVPLPEAQHPTMHSLRRTINKSYHTEQRVVPYRKGHTMNKRKSDGYTNV